MTIPNGPGAIPTKGAMQPKFDTTAITTFWMSSSARLMRSSEIFMRGMTAVTRLEAELGQQYMQRAMAALQTPGAGIKPDQFAGAQIDSLIATMRKIADEFRQTINDSTQALFDVASPAPMQSLAASVRIEDPVIARKPAPSAASPAVTA